MILKNELIFSEDSVIDPFGRVFFYKNEVYRLINKSAEKECIDLFKSGLIDELESKGYIPQTQITTALDIEDNPMILHHQKCTIIKPYEWSFEMFKCAAIHIINVNNICNQYGYELKDGHPFNVTFNDGKPIFFDIGSIIKKKETDWIAKKEYIETVIIPLLLWQTGNYYLLRAILESPDIYYRRVQPFQTPLQVSFFQKLVSCMSLYQIKRKEKIINTNSQFIIKIVSLLNSIIRIIVRKKRYYFFNITQTYRIPSISEIANYSLQERETTWMNYQESLNISDIIIKFPRYNSIFEIISRYCSDSLNVLDLAGNGGAFSVFLASKKKYKRIIMGDYDENAIDKGFDFFNKNNIPINTMWMNCMLPCEYESVIKRIKSDIVFGLAITHHLILSQGFSLDFIFERFKSYTNKYVVIEFMPYGLWDGIGKYPSVPEWYNQQWFSDSFSKYFKIRHIEEIETNRIVYVGELF